MAEEVEPSFDELEEPEDLEAVELEGLDDEELAEDDDDEVVAVVLTGDVLDDAEVVEPVEVVIAEEDDDEDDDDEVDPDEVEAGLDVILKDRLVVEDEEEVEEEEGAPPDPEDRAEGSTKVVPKRPEEFVCESCFLVKHPSQLADPKRMLCRDCV